MADMSAIDGEAASPATSATSVLGIKGSLRLRPHGSTQKAHVLLRRVVVCDDSGGDGDTNTIVYFSLFAQKRIEVKPGKEILMAVASADGRFKDQAMVFEGDFLGEESSDAEDKTQVAEEEGPVYHPIVGQAIPPKMRRAWIKKAEEVSPAIQVPIIARASTGAQAEPMTVSASVQAQIPCQATATQTDSRTFMSRSVQVDPPLPSPPRSLKVDTVNLHNTTDTKFHAGIPHVNYRQASAVFVKEEPSTIDLREMSDMEQSLSPMDLDSPTGSPIWPSNSPVFSPTSVPGLIASLDLTHSPVSSIASSSGAQDMQMSPIEITTPRILPGLSPATTQGQECFDSSDQGNKSHLPPNGSTLPGALPASPQSLLWNSPSSDSKALRDVNPIVASTTYPKPSPRLPRQVTQKLAIINPFVSAGFVTEFVGTTKEQFTPVKVKEEIIDVMPVKFSPPPINSDPSPVSSIASSNPSEPATPRSLPPHRLDIFSKPTATPNAIASSSKLTIDRKASFAIPLTSSYVQSAPQTQTSLSTRALEKSPVSASMLSTSVSQTASLPNTLSSSRNLPARPSGKRPSPPPDLKSIAYIPSGPSSNPLGIRPSYNPDMVRTPSQLAPPSGPRSLAQNASKKRVVVGTRWPFVRASTGAIPATITPVIPPVPRPPSVPMNDPTSQPPHPPGSRPAKSADLANIIHYASPSPPPLPPPPPAASKRKRVSDAELALAAIKHVQKQNDTKAWSLVDRIQPVANPTIPSPIIVQDSNAPKSDLLSRISTFSSSPVSAKKAVGKPKIAIPAPEATRTPQNLGAPPSHMDASSAKADLMATSTGRNGVPAPSTIENQNLPANPARLSTIASTSCKVTDPTQTPTNRKAAPAPLPITPVNPPPLVHPLPPKPEKGPLPPYRGVKRERASTPDLYGPEFVRRRRRAFRWPTIESSFTVGLKGDGDLAVKSICLSSDGSHFALSCADRTIRIWNNQNRAEIARLSHNAPVLAVAWMDADAGVVSLGDDGIVSKWARSGTNQWQWAKILDAGNERRSEDDQICLAYMQDRIAVSFPRTGVKVWVWNKGTWQPQRSILRQNVTAIKFVEDGGALLGGTRDGVLWHCEIPNGTLRACAFLKTKINSIDISPTGLHVLVGQVGGCARLVGTGKGDSKGTVEQSYACKETELRPTGGFGALFATRGQAILFGSVEGCVLVWDKKKAAIVYGLEHEEDDLIEAVAAIDAAGGREGYLITGTKGGTLAWWPQPVAATQAEEPSKRMKVGL